ncbi:transposase, truncated [Burkholderia pseudomallei]|nr:transposase, truncated [Burkholderia pseudomallei]
MARPLNSALAKAFSRLRYPFDVHLGYARGCAGYARGCAAYAPSLRHSDEMTAERDASADLSTAHRRPANRMPALARAFDRRERPVGKSGRTGRTGAC